MPRIDSTRAECRVFTFKEGLLSAVAHDLELRVGTFSIEWDESTLHVQARFDPSSVRVMHAVKGGRPAPGSLSAKDLRTIEGNITADVLEVARFPEIVFEADPVAPASEGPQAGSVTLAGVLSLHGRRVPVEAKAVRRGDAWVSRVRLHQPDSGITPYRAMMGTLRVQAHVEVEVRVPI